MRIAEIRTHHLRAQLDEPFSFSQFTYSAREAMLVEVRTDDGLTGWGEAYGATFGPEVMAAAIEDYAALVDEGQTEFWAGGVNEVRMVGLEAPPTLRQGERFDLEGAPVVVRQEASVFYDWEFGKPDKALPHSDRFSARWTRKGSSPSSTRIMCAMAFQCP